MFAILLTIYSHRSLPQGHGKNDDKPCYFPKKWGRTNKGTFLTKSWNLIEFIAQCAFGQKWSFIVCSYTRGQISTHSIKKHYNDYLDRRSCRSGWSVSWGYFFVIPLTLPMLIFEKKSTHRAVENLSNFWYYIRMTFYVIPDDFCQIFQELPAEIFFSKIGMGNECQGHNKICLQLTSI